MACQKNAALHQGTGRSPYQAMFGSPMRMGISGSLPSTLVPDMETENELRGFLEGLRVGDDGER